jgi:hypothetical protein
MRPADGITCLALGIAGDPLGVATHPLHVRRGGRGGGFGATAGLGGTGGPGRRTPGPARRSRSAERAVTAGARRTRRRRWQRRASRPPRWPAQPSPEALSAARWTALLVRAGPGSGRRVAGGSTGRRRRGPDAGRRPGLFGSGGAALEGDAAPPPAESSMLPSRTSRSSDWTAITLRDAFRRPLRSALPPAIRSGAARTPGAMNTVRRRRRAIPPTCHGLEALDLVRATLEQPGDASEELTGVLGHPGEGEGGGASVEPGRDRGEPGRRRAPSRSGPPPSRRRGNSATSCIRARASRFSGWKKKSCSSTEPITSHTGSSRRRWRELVREDAPLLAGVELEQRLGGEADLRPSEGDGTLQPVGGGEAHRRTWPTSRHRPSRRARTSGSMTGPARPGGEQPRPEHRQAEEERAGDHRPAEERRAQRETAGGRRGLGRRGERREPRFASTGRGGGRLRRDGRNGGHAGTAGTGGTAGTRARRRTGGFGRRAGAGWACTTDGGWAWTCERRSRCVAPRRCGWRGGGQVRRAPAPGARSHRRRE